MRLQMNDVNSKQLLYECPFLLCLINTFRLSWRTPKFVKFYEGSCIDKINLNETIQQSTSFTFWKVFPVIIKMTVQQKKMLENK